MSARVSLAVIAAAMLSAAGAHAACPPGQLQTGGCANVDLTGVPGITQQIVAHEATAPAKKPGAADAAPQPYTGPTVGVSDRARRAPMVGYHWSLD